MLYLKIPIDYKGLILLQAPNTAMGPNTMLPLLLMSDDSSNESLMFMMMMNQNKPDHCEPQIPVQPVQPVQPAQPVKTVYRTWRINEDGTKTLVDEE